MNTAAIDMENFAAMGQQGEASAQAPHGTQQHFRLRACQCLFNSLKPDTPGDSRPELGYVRHGVRGVSDF